MFRAFNNIPIFRRLFIVFAIAALIPILVIVLLGNFYLQSSEIRSQAVQTSFDAQNTATLEQINLQRMNALLQARFAQVFAESNPALGGDPSLRASGALTEADVTSLEINFGQTLVSYQQNFELATSDNISVVRNILISDAPDQGQRVITNQRTALDAVAHSEWNTYKKDQDRVLQDLDRHVHYQTAYADFYQANLDFLYLRNHWQQVVDAATLMGTTVTHVGPSLINPLLIYTAIALIFTFLVIIAAGFLINATIVNPLKQLVALTKKVGQGDTHARADILGRDEIYLVASSMNGMLDHILQLMQEAQFRHADLQAQIEKMIREVSGVGEGNLQIQLDVTTTELGVLANTFNGMTEQLSNLVVNVKILARGVQSAALQAFGYMEQLVDNADTQIKQITQATSEVGHVATSSRQVAERAQALYNVGSDARLAAQRGRSAVQQTVKRMEYINENVGSTSQKVQSLSERSREISSIVDVISSIAQQTNRLALDASIQAAMAGDHGQGFGAVADDIRRMAERAKQQSALVVQIVRNIREDISTAGLSMQETVRETASGTQIVHEVGNALEELFSAVEHQASEIEVTNQVAIQQLQSSNMIVQIMQRVSDVTQQNSAITRNITKQMERLAPLAGHLLASVDVFKLREDRHGVISENSSAQRQQALNRSSLPISSSAQSMGNVYGNPPFSEFASQSSSGSFMPSQPSIHHGITAQPEWQGQQDFQTHKNVLGNRSLKKHEKHLGRER
ncbi:MAG TPA: methyl-accepting chemotaxis protein [Ktedonobacteraceae bacterium]|nr:methyl-accepting chemotaxis protein [Ktedonobacteraceae bacterium]